MSFEYNFMPNGIVTENMRKLSSEQSMIQERRICELSELAYLAADCAEELRADGMEVCEILSILSDSLDFSEISIHPSYMEENLVRLTRHLRILGMLDKTLFSSLLIERLAERGIVIREQDFLPASSTGERFVYVKNSFSDEAYDVLSQDFADPRVAYAKDFKHAISMLSSTEADHCLLPLEDNGTRIRTVEELIFKGDLRINSVTPVFGLDGTADMKYCLVSRDYLISPYSSDDDRYIELRIPKDGDTPLTELLFSAEGFGLEAYRVNSISLSSEDGEKGYYSLLFRNVGGDFTLLLVYLTLFTRDFTTLGIYKNLE